MFIDGLIWGAGFIAAVVIGVTLALIVFARTAVVVRDSNDRRDERAGKMDAALLEHWEAMLAMQQRQIDTQNSNAEHARRNLTSAIANLTQAIAGERPVHEEDA